MKHILFIDPIENLSHKKDSSLMLATTLLSEGHEVYLLFEENFYFSNNSTPNFLVYNFSGALVENDFYIDKFELKNSVRVDVQAGDIIHMRIDPPFDTKYLRYLWLLRTYQSLGIRVVNSPDGILKFNEKLYAYQQKSSLQSYVGSSALEFAEFCKCCCSLDGSIILKPLDLFQGMGVEKLSANDPKLIEKFNQKVKDSGGPIVAQPFFADIAKGEIRSIYFHGEELGSILKIPKQGEFLANIAQGASFAAVNLTSALKQECRKISLDLKAEGIDLIAFDIMGGHISEINITCPGLLVEVSHAVSRNLASAVIAGI